MAIVRKPFGEKGRAGLPDGLDATDVAASAEQHGTNALAAAARRSFFGRLTDNFRDPIIRVLLAALGINVLFSFRDFDWIESIGIVIAILLATIISTASEYGSEMAFARLQEEASSQRCRVRREGKTVELAVEDLVVGDILLIGAGERIPADLILLSGSLRVDQSALNGESREVRKTPARNDIPGENRDDDSEWRLDDPNRLYRGSVVCSGEGVARVGRVGGKTFYGGIARDLQTETRESPLKVRLSHLARDISRIGYAAAVIVALAHILVTLVSGTGGAQGEILARLLNPRFMIGELMQALTLGITIVVVAVPEGLPMMITVVLSSNMRRMLRDKILIKKPVGIETAGSLNILFTDKTGTVTEGKLSLTSILTADGHEYRDSVALRESASLYHAFLASAYRNTAATPAEDEDGKRAVGGNATDRAVLDAFLGEPAPACRTTAVLSFDSARKYSAAATDDGRVFYKGAPEILLPLCRTYLEKSGKSLPFDSGSPICQAWKRATEQGFRVIAVTMAESMPQSGHLPAMTLAGLLVLRDRVRPEAAAAMREVQRAGVQVVMLTGDNRSTAAAVAAECGLITPGRSLILTGEELASMSDRQLKELLPRLCIVARSLPADKTRLVRLAQELNLVVGMTGDGVNDAPALKLADVGFAMGSGTDVAKEAADAVILDNNFASLVRAVRYGRTVFHSIRKFITFQLTMNLCAVGVTLVGPFIGVDTPITIIQMLWINIIMDTLGGLAFAGEPPLESYMEEKPKRRDERILNGEMIHRIVVTGGFTLALSLFFLQSSAIRTMFSRAPLTHLTAFFALFIFCGLLNSFNTRSEGLNPLRRLGRNKPFLFIMTGVAAVQILMVYFGGSVFRTTPLTSHEFLSVICFALPVIPAEMVRKLLRRRRRKSTGVIVTPTKGQQESTPGANAA